MKTNTYYQLEKHALHITDNDKETKEIFDLILTKNVKNYTTELTRFNDKFNEFKLLLTHVYLINLKVKVSRFLRLMN